MLASLKLCTPVTSIFTRYVGPDGSAYAA